MFNPLILPPEFHKDTLFDAVDALRAYGIKLNESDLIGLLKRNNLIIGEATFKYNHRSGIIFLWGSPSSIRGFSSEREERVLCNYGGVIKVIHLLEDEERRRDGIK